MLELELLLEWRWAERDSLTNWGAQEHADALLLSVSSPWLQVEFSVDCQVEGDDVGVWERGLVVRSEVSCCSCKSNPGDDVVFNVDDVSVTHNVEKEAIPSVAGEGLLCSSS